VLVEMQGEFCVIHGLCVQNLMLMFYARFGGVFFALSFKYIVAERTGNLLTM